MNAAATSTDVLAVREAARRLNGVPARARPGARDGDALTEEARRRRLSVCPLFPGGYGRNAMAPGGRPDRGVQLVTKPFTDEELSRRVRQAPDPPCDNVKGGA